MPPQIDLKGIYQESEHRNYVWEAVRVINTSNDIVLEIETVLEYIKEHYDMDVSYTYAQSYLSSSAVKPRPSRAWISGVSHCRPVWRTP